jgi:hypothetical protein
MSRQAKLHAGFNIHYFAGVIHDRKYLIASARVANRFGEAVRSRRTPRRPLFEQSTTAYKLVGGVVLAPQMISRFRIAS